jgi:VIT1/CCC1 family predicted Fe2+/Mn2+ transporter
MHQAISIEDVQLEGMKKTIPYTPHHGSHRQYMRDIILGVNDGLVSMFLLVFGMYGGHANSHSILLASISGTVAGAISMGLGEYIATKSQSEMIQSDLALEETHFLHHRDVEMEELRVTLFTLGLRDQLLNDCVIAIGDKDETLLAFMKAFEFGYSEEEQRNPCVAMGLSGLLFMTGSLPSILPFFITNQVEYATLYAGILSSLVLFLVGSIKSKVTQSNWICGGIENLGLGVIGSAISYSVGLLFSSFS